MRIKNKTQKTKKRKNKQIFKMNKISVQYNKLNQTEKQL